MYSGRAYRNLSSLSPQKAAQTCEVGQTREPTAD